MIARLGLEHVEDVARLHRENLTGLLTTLGPRAIRAFYTGFVRTKFGIGFVYLDGAMLRGFVVGSQRPGELKVDTLRKNVIGTLAGICVGIARRPSALVSLMKSFRGPDEGSYNASVPELTYLAVSGANRGAGIGSQLVGAFTEAIGKSGGTEYELSVDEGNDAAIAFYERLGFILRGRYREFGIMHRRYRLEIVTRKL